MDALKTWCGMRGLLDTMEGRPEWTDCARAVLTEGWKDVPTQGHCYRLRLGACLPSRYCTSRIEQVQSSNDEESAYTAHTNRTINFSYTVKTIPPLIHSTSA
jgi:hypothetical protein